MHRSLGSCVVYKFSCAGGNSVYIGETTRHLSTRVREQLYTDKNSHIFKNLKIHLHVKVFVMKVVSKYWIQLTISGEARAHACHAVRDQSFSDIKILCMKFHGETVHRAKSYVL